MSQYDHIGSKYNIFKLLPTSAVEAANLHAVLRDRIAGSRVLDLACGTGYYSHKLIEWGADFVMGIDLSSAMLQAAKESVSLREEQAASLEFRVGNALELGKIEDQESFDLVIGVWLLNYAANAGQMAQMFRTISTNLKPGGSFVGITPHPAADLDAFAQMINDFEKEQPNQWGIKVDYFEKLESGEGWRTELTGQAGEDRVQFRNFHLHRSIYEQGAIDGGMTGQLEWRRVVIPEESLEVMGRTHWNLYFDKGPHMGVLVVDK
ncbi:methyltransferase type 11 [Xylariales sp. PMI_506]|nr:methyltransferase type 11 [Xylariales sp. PMI_506]